jgi:hypothetical protein
MILGSTVLAVGSFIAGAWAQSLAKRPTVEWPESMEAVSAAPKNHKVLYEDSQVRLLEIFIQPGETENMHWHKWPTVYAFNAPVPKAIGNMLDGSKVDYPRDYVDADWSTPQCRTAANSPTHGNTITDSFPAHFYNIEFKNMVGNSIMSMKEYPRS